MEKILQGEAIPNGENGYYFAVAHKLYCWDLMQRFAEQLYALGLMEEPKTHTWPSDEMAAVSLGVPPMIARIMGTHWYTLFLSPWRLRRELTSDAAPRSSPSTHIRSGGNLFGIRRCF